MTETRTRLTDERLRALSALCKELYIVPGDRSSTAGEDAGFYFLPPDDEDFKPVRRYVAVTATAGDDPHFFVYADFDTVSGAQEKAIENVTDDIFSEIPVQIVDLDTGVRYWPRWDSLQWTKQS